MSESRLSRAVQATTLPPIPIAARWAAAYKGTNLINLSQGVPGSPPHDQVTQRLSEVVKLGDSAGYGAILGDAAMRQALVEEIKFVYGGGQADVKFDDVALSAGCNAAFMAAVMAIVNKGDEIILPVPWYFNHEMTLRMLGIDIVPLPVSIENGFVPTIAQTELIITPRTKAIVLVTPNNPASVIYPPSLIESFSSLAAKHNIFLILDETYRDFVTPGPPHSLFTQPTWRTTLIHLFSFSKSYRVPGHRLGALVAGPDVLENVFKVLDSRPLQLALAPILPSLRSDLADQAKELETRHAVFKQTLTGSGWEIGSAGAYFALVKHPFKGVRATEVCKRLAEEDGVVLLPLSFFAPADDSAWDSWMRVSVANVGAEAVREAAVRMVESDKRAHEWKPI
ncbi:aminotransferase class I and II protein [Ceratobasidium sp. AG-Ba]|nr:aminotransferase class I and II protein [Ceratobasidium sp. AG-Ba]